MSITAPQVKYVTANNVRCNVSPFNLGEHIKIVSVAGTTMYGVNAPGTGSTTKYAAFKQSISGNKCFDLPSAVNVPQNTVSGALSAANQLRVVVLVDGAIPAGVRARGDQVAPTNAFLVAYGGGTNIADATTIVKGTTAANIALGATALSVASTGANTQTILVGDKITNSTNGDTTVYTCTETSQALNGTTEVLVSITPPLQKAAVASDVLAIATGGTTSAKGILLADAPAVGALVEVWVLDSGDVTTITGGAMTAGREYDVECMSVFHSAGNVNLCKL